MSRTMITYAIIAAVALQGCSSRPRAFNATLAAPPADQAAFEADVATCNRLLVEGKLDRNGRSASAGAGAAAGATTAAVGGATAAAIGGYGGLAAASATIVLLPFALVGGAWGMAKMKRAKKEKAIQTAMAGCLAERGHQVTGWVKAKKQDAGREAKLAPVTSAETAAPPTR